MGDQASDMTRADIETDGSMGGPGRARDTQTERRTDRERDREREKKLHATLWKDMSVWTLESTHNDVPEATMNRM